MSVLTKKHHANDLHHFESRPSVYENGNKETGQVDDLHIHLVIKVNNALLLELHKAHKKFLRLIEAAEAGYGKNEERVKNQENVRSEKLCRASKEKDLSLSAWLRMHLYYCNEPRWRHEARASRQQL